MFTAATAFSATNLDDIVILTLLFSRLDAQLRPHHVIGGQLLGFLLLVLISSAALFGRLLLPLPWLGLLGLLPVSLGVSALLKTLAGGSPEPDAPAVEVVLPWPAPVQAAEPIRARAGGIWAPLLAVTLLTLANGSDNIGVYVPLFARASAAELAITLLTFAVGLALWCLLAWRLTRLPDLACWLRLQATWLVPLVLIALGAMVLLDSHCLAEPLPALICLGCLLPMAVSVLRLMEHPQLSTFPAAPTSLAATEPSGHTRA